MAAPPLTPLERRLGLTLGVVATVAFVVLSNGLPVFLAVGLAMGVGLTAAAWAGNRIAAAFVAFATTFGPWGFAAIFGAPYAIYALWLLARASKVTTPERPPAPSGGRRAARRDGGRAT